MTPISDLWRIEQENFTGQVPTFRQFLMPNVISDIGAFMQSVGAAWFMLSFGAGPIYVALIQTASSLPFLSSLCRQDPIKVAYLILVREFSL
ncbi:MAG TPA: MFS transporter [Candidatus Binatia bacterium]|nr:MFS transporter [Candidatus Binatia bacterium]